MVRVCSPNLPLHSCLVSYKLKTEGHSSLKRWIPHLENKICVLEYDFGTINLKYTNRLMLPLHLTKYQIWMHQLAVRVHCSNRHWGATGGRRTVILIWGHILGRYKCYWERDIRWYSCMWWHVHVRYRRYRRGWGERSPDNFRQWQNYCSITFITPKQTQWR